MADTLVILSYWRLILKFVNTYNSNIYVILLLLFWWSPLIPSRNLDEVSLISYNHIAIMSLRSRYHVKASADHLCIHNYIISLLNTILRPTIMILTGA